MLPTKIPTITELYSDKEEVIRLTELAILLNSEPKPEWVKGHPNIGNARYIPIGIVEYLLTRIFGKWRVEIKESKTIANSVVVTVRLHFVDPLTGKWDWQDGIGAAPMQTDKGAGAVDFNAIKSAAVMMAAPAAESYAIKDAAEKLGKLFGKDLNRKDVMGYDSLAKENEARMGKVLTPTHPRWNDAVKSLKNGNATIDDICHNYEVSEENRLKLMDDAF